MKTKLIYGCFAVFAIGIGIYSCKKNLPEEIASHQPIGLPMQAPLVCNYDVPLVCNNQIPHYSTQQVFDAVYQCLEAQYEQYNDNFEAAHPNLSDDAYDDLVDSLGFDEETTLKNWEVSKGYGSLRTHLNNEEAIWLANGMDPNTDPFDHAVSDLILLTMMNTFGDIRIANDLIHVDPDGTQLIVSNADCAIFDSAKADPNYTNPNLQRLTPAPPDVCERRKNEEGMEDWANNSNRRFKWRIDFDAYIQSSSAKSIMRNFRKKNGNWKKATAHCTVSIDGVIWNSECIQSVAIGIETKTKTRKRVAANRFPLSYGKIKTSEVLGYFRPTNGNIYIDTAIVW
jgi:hypothetical protein